MAEAPGVYIYQDRAREWRWSLVAENNLVVADSAKGYESKSEREQAVERVGRIINDGRLHRHDSPPPGY